MNQRRKLIWTSEGELPEDGDVVLVLDGLGKSLNSALKRLFGASVIDEELVKELVKDIQRALLVADVEVSLVMAITERVQEQALDESLPRGVSRREHIVQVVWDTLAFFLGCMLRFALSLTSSQLVMLLLQHIH